MLLALNNPTVHYFSLDIEGAELKVFFYTTVGNYINTMNSTFSESQIYEYIARVFHNDVLHI